MSYDATAMRRAADRLEENRRARADRVERLRIQTYERQPRLAQLDKELQGTMSQLVAAALRRGENPARAIEAVKERNLDLQRERAVLLGAMGLPEDALDSKPACPFCNDTGWRGATMCSCLKSLCTEEQIKELSKLLDLGEQSFDAFRIDYYSRTPWPGRGVSPRENMELVYEVCLNYAQKFGRFSIPNLFLSGAPGLGKTFLSACIARTVSEKGFSVVYDTAGNVFAQFEVRKFQRDSQDGLEARDETRRYLNCDLLILDDLGSELTTQFTQSALYELVNTRLVAGRNTVISSNLSMEEAARRYSPQIASRLEGEYHILHFFGDDIRLVKKSRL
ncbi:MAG: ATP-binding protein [Lawsonibacter sp.]